MTIEIATVDGSWKVQLILLLILIFPNSVTIFQVHFYTPISSKTFQLKWKLSNFKVWAHGGYLRKNAILTKINSFSKIENFEFLAWFLISNSDFDQGINIYFQPKKCWFSGSIQYPYFHFRLFRDFFSREFHRALKIEKLEFIRDVRTRVSLTVRHEVKHSWFETELKRKS